MIAPTERTSSIEPMSTDAIAPELMSSAGTRRVVPTRKSGVARFPEGPAELGEEGKVSVASPPDQRLRTETPNAAAAAPSETPARAIESQLGDWVELTKPRIVTMILVTTVASALIAAVSPLSLFDWLALLLGTAAVAGSAGAANQIWERVIDGRMPRTASRPLPGGRVTVAPACCFTALLGLSGAGLLWLRFGLVPAAVGVGTWILYVLVYTPMKTRTAWNTTVGAVAGALPILIGYTAGGGLLADATGWLLFAVLAAWQYPHFMAIAWMYRRQYAEAGFQMATTVEPSGRSAGWQSIVGSLVLIVSGVFLSWIPGGGAVGLLAAAAVVASGAPMLWASLQFATDPNDRRARKLLRSSLLVLPLVLAIVTLRVVC